MNFIHYENLEAYKLAYKLAIRVHKLVKDLPSFEQFGGLADQMRRASRGVCANIAEGLSKQSSDLEEKRFLNMALGSCEEMRVWGSMGVDFQYWDKKTGEAIREKYHELGKIIGGLKRVRK